VHDRKYSVHQSVDPVVSANLSTARTSRGLAGMGNHKKLLTLFTAKDMTSQHRGAAVQKALDLISHALAHSALLPCKVSFPVIVIPQDENKRDFPS